MKFSGELLTLSFMYMLHNYYERSFSEIDVVLARLGDAAKIIKVD